MSIQFDSRWFQHLEDNKKAELKKLLLGDEYILGILYRILCEEEDKLREADVKLDEYNSPAWPYLKADRLGQLRAIKQIKRLLDFTQQKE